MVATPKKKQKKKIPKKTQTHSLTHSRNLGLVEG